MLDSRRSQARMLRVIKLINFPGIIMFPWFLKKNYLETKKFQKFFFDFFSIVKAWINLLTMLRKRWIKLLTFYRTQHSRPVQDVLRGWRLNIHKIYCYGSHRSVYETRHEEMSENAYQWIVLVCLKSHILHVLSAAAVKSVVSDALMASTWLLCPSTMCVQIKGEPTFICKSKNAFKHGQDLNWIPYLPTKIFNGTSRRGIKLTSSKSWKDISILPRNISSINDGRCGRWNEVIVIAFYRNFVNLFFFKVSVVHDNCEVSFLAKHKHRRTAGKVTLKRRKQTLINYF